jgi:uncharacterized repeat protein (TIGR01451 family)
VKRSIGVVLGSAAAVLLLANPLAAHAGVAYTANISKSHGGNFTVGTTGTFTVTLTVTAGSTSGAIITVTDTLPTGLTYDPTGSGNGTWSCGASGQTVTCTATPNLVNPAVSSFPIVVTVLAAAVPAATNHVSYNDNCGCRSGASTTTAQDTVVVLPLTTAAPSPTANPSPTPSAVGKPTPDVGAGEPPLVAFGLLLLGATALTAAGVRRRRG